MAKTASTLPPRIQPPLPRHITSEEFAEVLRNAPEDDEELSPETERRLLEAVEESEMNPNAAITTEELIAQLGWTDKPA